MLLSSLLLSSFLGCVAMVTLLGALFGVRERERARNRAVELLIDHLSEEQKLQIRQRGRFNVFGNRTGTLYSIDATCRNFNIMVLSPGLTLPFMNPLHVGERLCAVPRIPSLPLSDVVLTQKIMLECNEVAVLRVANGISYKGGE